MKEGIERRTAAALDLLDALQIAALYIGSLRRGNVIRTEPQPRKHNVVARANAADLYQSVLDSELIYGLTKRDARKARSIAEELKRSTDRAHHGMARELLEHLDAEALDKPRNRSGD